MSGESRSMKIAVIGAGDFAEKVGDMVHRATEHELAAVVAPGAELPAGTELILSVAPVDQRLAVVEQANAAGLPIATLPLSEGGQQAEQAVRSGRVAQVSTLLGYAALARLQWEVAAGALGRRYALFAAHRVRQGAEPVFDGVGLPLLHYAIAVLGEVPVAAQVTRASLFGDDPDAWFTILRCADGTLATIEFAASLPPAAAADEQILVEATGSDMVLRAEPTRQAVLVAARDRTNHERGWWADLAPRFTEAAIAAAQQPDAAREVAALRLIDAVRRSAETGQPLDVAAD